MLSSVYRISYEIVILFVKMHFHLTISLIHLKLATLLWQIKTF